MNKRAIVVVFAWSALLALLLLYRWVYSFDKYVVSTIVLALVDLTCLLLLAVVITRVLLPKMLYREKVFEFAAFLVVALLVCSQLIQQLGTAWYTIVGTLDDTTWAVYDSLTYQFFSSYLIAMLGGFGITAIAVTSDRLKAQRRLEALQREKVEAELNFLKAQVNPHFLFNAINTVFFQIDKQNATARNSLHMFSEMLRYQLYECNRDLVDIEKEINYLHYYVAIQRMRRNNSNSIDFSCDYSVKDFKIAPMIMIPFVENAFKHSDGNVKIQLSKPNGKLKFDITNDITTSNGIITDDKGIGLTNVKRRLELLYPGRHKLHVDSNENCFTVNLTIEP